MPNRAAPSFWRLTGLLVLGLAVVAVTAGVIDLDLLDFLDPYRVQLIAAEVALLGIVAVELLSSILSRKARQGVFALPSPALRPVVRFLGYAALGVSLLSLLSRSPALAVGVGSVTGLVVGLAAQSVIGNALAGSILAVVRPFEIGAEITVMGLTGRVVEVGSMYTLIDAGEREALVPNVAMLTTVIQRAKPFYRAEEEA